ncbi:unnamed protein product [Caenorhabditis bovis]|uniref:Palmitoyltransferase n=1 Tax=Caenorhabditis bovis TaxID=2654633 RepID=A0A8S1EAZ8_9PELO|nr:unnamed protein product [Caenorhabditis bovis]
MSWYSKIYTAVREYRAIHPFIGRILTFLLNILLITQVVGLFISFYVFLTITCGYYLKSSIQVTIYLIIATFLFVMSLWSLAKTLFTPIARVPPQYRPPKALDEKLRAATPCDAAGKFVVESSSPEQIREQSQIIIEMCEVCDVKMAECDHVGRLKYCYECGHLKPDRARHCGSCGQCCVKFDHHCPWINMCVTHANYKYFLLYVVYTTAFVYWYLLTSIEGVIRFVLNQNYSQEVDHLMLYLFTGLLGGVFGYYPLGELILFHWQLISLNETTVEQTKPAVLRFDNLADYNMGKKANFEHVFGWGLWWLPIETSESDGLHFDIRYVNQHNKCRFIKVRDDELTSSSDIASQNGSPHDPPCNNS